MCGIAGLISAQPVDPAVLSAMTDAIRHRGPDDAGLWRDERGQVALGQRRLSILDLSAAGHQPMASASGRLILDYNGEIYNHLDLRTELEAAGKAPAWRGHSDTETLLAAFAAWGVEPTLARTAGMFALALWNADEDTLTLATDRFGEKPLYYGHVSLGFGFASELKALRALPGFAGAIDADALRGLFATGYVGATRSIWQDLSRLAPGSIARISRADALAGQPPRVSRWYDHRALALQGSLAIGEDEASEELERLLDRAISRQLVADVPVGAFLSGGVDSSLVCAIAARAIGSKLKTFSIGFSESAYDESPFAAAVARHIGSDHREMIVTPQQALDMIPRLPAIFDEPFGDSSQIPTLLVSGFAREHVTVALSGDAGDEMFGGYNRYLTLPRLWRAAGRVAAPLRRAVLGQLGALPPGLWNRAAALATGHARPPFWGQKVSRTLGLAAGARDFAGLFGAFLDEWHGLPDPVPAASGGWRGQLPDLAGLKGLSFEEQLMLGDIGTYLPNDILVKVDRSTMAVSLEGRAPFLDPGVAAFAARLPVSLKIAGGRSKLPLRRLLYRLVPRELIERPKAGFAVPVDAWLRGPLRDWAESLLSKQALERCGLIDPAPVRRRWQAHLAGRENAAQALWPILMFQSWLEA